MKATQNLLFLVMGFLALNLSSCNQEKQYPQQDWESRYMKRLRIYWMESNLSIFNYDLFRKDIQEETIDSLNTSSSLMDTDSIQNKKTD